MKGIPSLHQFDHSTGLRISGWGIDHDRSNHPMRGLVEHFRRLDGEPDEGDGYEWCWIACPHDPPCACAPPSSDPRDE